MMIKTLRQFRRPRVALLPPMAVLLACALGLAPEAQGSEALMPAVENKTPLQMPAQAAARPAYLARAQRRFDQGSQGSQQMATNGDGDNGLEGRGGGRNSLKG